MTRREIAKANFMKGYNCSQSIVLAFEDLLPIDGKVASKMASSFGGGMGRLREVCGAVSGMFMVAGFLYGYDGPETGDVKAQHYARIQELARRFEEEHGSIVCREMLGLSLRHDVPTPEARTKEYYQKRPCPEIIGDAAQILEEYIKENPVPEYFDITDDEGTPTGEVVERSVAHDKGIPHRTAHIWVVRRKGDSYEVLLQKRSAEKDSFPGLYDTSSAGHIQAGDEPLQSAKRELCEELGIAAKDGDLSFAGRFHINYEMEFHGKPFRDNEIAFVYVYDKPVEIKELNLQKEEVEEVKWFDIEEVRDGCKKRDASKDKGGIFCVPMEGLEVLMKYLGIA